jgi:phage terminase large subunit-like protein
MAEGFTPSTGTKIDLNAIPNVAGNLQGEALRHVSEWAAERERILREDPLNHGFPPHAGQLRVHESTKDEVLVIGANRSGKSTTGIREVLWRATMTHPYKKTRPCDVIWCGFKDFGFYIRITKRLFEEWVPKGRLIQYHESEKWARVKRSDGGVCTLYFLSYESGRMAWQGGAVDFMWLDEELPQEVYHEATARLIDRRGQLVLTQTPVSGLGWLYEEIYIPAITGMRPNTEVVQIPLAKRDPTAELEVGEILVPHLTREQVLRLARAAKTPEDRAIRVFGEFRGRSGGVYKEFDTDVHVVPSFKVPRYYEVWGGCDPGYHGFAACLFAIDPKGRIYVPFEYFSQQENHSARAKALWEGVQQHVQLDEDDYIVFYCDTANPQDIMELNSWSQQAGARMVFHSLDHGLKARDAGLQRVSEYLMPLKSRETPKEVTRPTPDKGEPMLYFFDTLEATWVEQDERVETSRLLWEIRRYTWRQPRRNDAHPKDADEKSAGGAHMLAALRYGIMARVSSPDAPAEGDPREKWDPMVRAHMERREARGLSGLGLRRSGRPAAIVLVRNRVWLVLYDDEWGERSYCMVTAFTADMAVRFMYPREVVGITEMDPGTLEGTDGVDGDSPAADHAGGPPAGMVVEQVGNPKPA